MSTTIDLDDLTQLELILNGLLETSAFMVQDWQNDTRFGDFMMDRLDTYLNLLCEHAEYYKISSNYKDYESNDYFNEWNKLSTLESEERLKKAKNLLKICLTQLSINLNEIPLVLNKTMMSNCLLLHTILGTLDLHYNKIEGIFEVLTNSQKSFLSDLKKFDR